MRVVTSVAILVTVCMLLGASTVNADGGATTCQPSTKIPSRLVARTKIPSVLVAPRGDLVLVCKTGKAVVRTASGVSHQLTPSACFIGANGARLYFGPYPWDRASERPRGLYLVVGRDPEDHSRAVVVDGGLQLTLGTNIAIIGTARLRDGLRSGTFTIRNGLKGKLKYTGQWTCGTPLVPKH